MSRTVVFDTYGAPDVLRVIDVNLPEPGTGQVRVAVKAAGVQPFDSLFRSGAAHQWIPANFPQRLGNEFAGVVDAVGGDVNTVAVGDEVLGWAMLASYAEHVTIGTDDIVAKPAGGDRPSRHEPRPAKRTGLTRSRPRRRTSGRVPPASDMRGVSRGLDADMARHPSTRSLVGRTRRRANRAYRSPVTRSRYV